MCQPLTVPLFPDRQDDIGLGLGLRNIAHFFGPQQIVSVGLAYGFAHLALASAPKTAAMASGMFSFLWKVAKSPSFSREVSSSECSFTSFTKSAPAEAAPAAVRLRPWPGFPYGIFWPRRHRRTQRRSLSPDLLVPVLVRLVILGDIGGVDFIVFNLEYIMARPISMVRLNSSCSFCWARLVQFFRLRHLRQSAHPRPPPDHACPGSWVANCWPCGGKIATIPLKSPMVSGVPSSNTAITASFGMSGSLAPPLLPALLRRGSFRGQAPHTFTLGRRWPAEWSAHTPRRGKQVVLKQWH